MSTERERVYLDLHKNFVKEGVLGRDGHEFNTVTIPAGVILGGQDIGGYKFYPLYVNESRRSENWRTIPLLEDKEIQLIKVHLGEDGQPLLDASGEKVSETIHVNAKQLVGAVDLARNAYREDHPRETVWVNVHRSFAVDKGLFWSVGLAPNTMIDGKDYGNYRFTVSAVNPSQFHESVLGVPLDPNRSYRLAGGDNFSDVAYVKGITLKEAIETARAVYRAEKAAERATERGDIPPGDDQEMGDLSADLDDEIGRALAASEATHDDWHHDEQELAPMADGR